MILNIFRTFRRDLNFFGLFWGRRRGEGENYVKVLTLLRIAIILFQFNCFNYFGDLELHGEGSDILCLKQCFFSIYIWKVSLHTKFLYFWDKGILVSQHALITYKCTYEQLCTLITMFYSQCITCRYFFEKKNKKYIHG